MSTGQHTRFELPAAVKPVWQLVVHLAIGAAAFASVLVIAVLLAGFIHLLALVPFAPEWLTRAAEFVEQALFVLDLLTAGLFLAAEVVKFTKRIWSEVRND